MRVRSVRLSPRNISVLVRIFLLFESFHRSSSVFPPSRFDPPSRTSEQEKLVSSTRDDTILNEADDDDQSTVWDVKTTRRWNR